MHCKQALVRGSIFPPDINKILQEEELSVQLVLAVLQHRITIGKHRKERKESKANKEKTARPQRGSGTRTSSRRYRPAHEFEKYFGVS